MAGLLTRPSVRFTAATSSAECVEAYWTAITSCPSACSAGIITCEARAIGPDAVTENDAWFWVGLDICCLLMFGKDFLTTGRCVSCL